MFQMKPSVQTITEVCDSLGWTTTVIGPVIFGGVEFWASVTLDEGEHERRVRVGELGHTDRRELERHLSSSFGPELAARPRPPLRLEGVIVVDKHAEQAVKAASYFAGYCPRAALVPDVAVNVECTALAAMVDVALLAISESGGAVKLAGCGPKSAGASFNAREWHLLETVYQAMRGGARETAILLAGT